MQKRDKKGKYSKRSKLWLVLIAFVIYLPIVLLSQTSQVTYAADDATTTVQYVDNSAAKVAQLKAETVQLISQCEVPNFKEGDAPIILDTNNKMSIGPMMFQVATVIEYEKKLYGKSVTKYEATQIALDPVESKNLATDIIFKDGGAGNWFNCSNKLSINQRVKLIREFESH